MAAQKDGKGSVYNWVDPHDKSGEFKRKPSAFRDWISTDPGARFPPEKDRCMTITTYTTNNLADILQIPSIRLLRLPVGPQSFDCQTIEGLAGLHSLHLRPLAAR